MLSLTVAQCLAYSSRLASVSDSARLDVELLLMHILQQNRAYLFAWPEKQLSQEHSIQFERAFARRLAGEPIAHITGQREFWSLPLAVNNSTLIPRPDTEVLVESVLELFAQDAIGHTRHCLDLGTGTGAIVLALASEKPEWQFLGVDYSADAVALAENNRSALGFNHVRMQLSNWFAQIPAQQFDVIVSNPPYIDAQDVHLHQGDLRFEPRSALVAANRGLADIEEIVQMSRTFLHEGGWLLLEHGYQQAEAVRQLMRSRGFVHISTRCDYAGNERVTMGAKPGTKNGATNYAE